MNVFFIVRHFHACNWRGFHFKLECCCIQKLLIPINMLKSISFCAECLLVSFIKRPSRYVCMFVYDENKTMYKNNDNKKKWLHYFSVQQQQISNPFFINCRLIYLNLSIEKWTGVVVCRRFMSNRHQCEYNKLRIISSINIEISN